MSERRIPAARTTRRRLRRYALGWLLAALAASAAAAIPGYPDRQPGASLLVPFFETGVDVVTGPEDTLLVVTNFGQGARTFHYHVWNVNGVAAFSGNVTLAPVASWEVAMRDLIAPQPGPVRQSLTIGGHWRGFVTIDVVTSATSLAPTAASFPFANDSDLIGFIYYTRLSRGSANGLSMIPLETVSHVIDRPLRRPYPAAQMRESIDVDAATCAHRKANGLPCANDSNRLIRRLDNRLFGSCDLNGRTRVVVFTWSPGFPGGPTTYCGSTGACPPTYRRKIYVEHGATTDNSMVALHAVVNVFDIHRCFSGWVSIEDVPIFSNDMIVYTFAFNSAAPGLTPTLTWDAIFAGYVEP